MEKNNLIAYSTAQGVLKSVKSNGDSSQTLDNANFNLVCDWNIHGQKILLTRYVQPNYHTYIYDYTSNLIEDTVATLLPNLTVWPKDSFIYSGYSNGISNEIGFVNRYLNKLTYNDLVGIGFSSFINSLDIDTIHNIVYWADTHTGVYSTELSTQKTNCIKPGCESRSYS
ncbi:MAG: hypothetical protein M0D57_10480 [Sphingobacteriales bacterium JAD_PAG50586_3]|nr:MAG: hypothetical protein M0D57_10480 [Sphingobacteriales bacterium JAD_PAG50586_3]